MTMLSRAPLTPPAAAAERLQEEFDPVTDAN